jgi:hypothetical protein
VNALTIPADFFAASERSTEQHGNFPERGFYIALQQ